jgi:hypothetical protein
LKKLPHVVGQEKTLCDMSLFQISLTEINQRGGRLSGKGAHCSSSGGSLRSSAALLQASAISRLICITTASMLRPSDEWCDYLGRSAQPGLPSL